MNYEDISKTYKVCSIKENNINDVLNLCKGNPVYYEYMKEDVTKQSLLNDMKALPPNKTYDDKFYLGFYEDNVLIAIMDLILKYPNDETFLIGFFMMNCDFQGTGIGSKIVNELIAYLKSNNFKYARLAYIDGNEQSKCFWLKNDFKPTGDVSKTQKYKMIVMERNLNYGK